MRFEPLELSGAWRIDLEPRTDERGWFARTFCADEFALRGIDPVVLQENISRTNRAGTLRGMHFQTGDAAEGKHVRCTRGRVHDVLVDLRPTSPTHRRWVAMELSEESRTTLYAPPGTAHGFLTLTADAEVEYRMTKRHEPAAASGVRWDDPALAIEWPERPTFLSERDASWPDYTG